MSYERGRKVLLIDDSEIQSHFARQTLIKGGFDVRVANTLVEFDHILATWWPDIVLSDVQMPEISGGELCQILKSRMATKNTPVVLFSSIPEEELAELAKKCGADGYLCKQNGLERLCATIESLWESIIW